MTLFAITVPEVLYEIYKYAVPPVILAVLFGFRWKAGLWGNALSLGAVLFSALIAVGWWEDAAQLLAGLYPPILFMADCIAFWLLFLLSLLILDTATRFLSSVKVKFNNTVENVGNAIILLHLFSVLFQVHTFANGHLGMVGEHYADRNKTPITVENNPNVSNPYASINLISLLSTGNLSGFSQVQEFDENGMLLERHLQRRQAIMNGMQGQGEKMLADEGLFDSMDRGR